jgi:hypothetical protein
VHKLLLTAIIPFFDTQAQIGLGMVAAIVYLQIILVVRPYYR